jgi:L-fuconolactonase
MPDFPIVDAHVHLYDPGRVGYPWMRDEPRLDRPHLLADYRAAVAGVDVEAVVFVEVAAAPDQRLAEAEFVAGLAAADPLVAGIVASAGLDSGGAELDALAAVPGVRGIRQLIQGHLDEPGWCLREPFVEAVRGLAARDLSFDLCVYHPQLADAAELVRRCPDVRFVLDHIGKPGIRAGLSEPWRRDITALAALPNVWCKISGVATEADHAAWTEAELAPYVAHAIEAFGCRRAMFGGDWPVSTLATSYPRWVALVDAVAAGASPADRRRLWRETAIDFYRLDL